MVPPEYSARLTLSHSTPKDFARFYAQLSPNVRRFFARHIQDSHTVYDLEAETFAKAFAKRHHYRGASDAEAAAWLWSIARNELMRYKRSRSIELAALTRLKLERVGPSEPELSQIERLLALEGIGRESLPHALDGLPADQRQAIRLRFYEDLSNEEIAQRLAVSNSVVRARISRALRTLGNDQRLQSAIEALADT